MSNRNSIQSTNYQLLDKLLRELSKGDTFYHRKEFVIQEAMDTYFTADSFKLFIEELVRLKYVESSGYEASPSYRITLQGLLFLERGGFDQSLKSSRSLRSERYRSKLLLTTSTISVMFLTMISTCVQFRDSQSNKASIEKNINSLKNKIDSLQKEINKVNVSK